MTATAILIIAGAWAAYMLVTGLIGLHRRRRIRRYPWGDGEEWEITNRERRHQ